MDHSQFEGTSGDNSRPAGQEVESHYILEEGALAAGLGAQDGNPGEGDFLIEAVVADLIDDVDQFADIPEEIGLEELAFA